MAPIIRTEKLRKVYAVGKERVVALNNVDLSIEKGEFCCIVGQSGSGKSTLLNQLAGLEKPTSGKFIRKARDQRHERELNWPSSGSSTWGSSFRATTCCPP